MISGSLINLIILAVLIVSLLYILQAEGGVAAVPKILQRLNLDPQWWEWLKVPTRMSAPASSQPRSYTSGESRFSWGNCTQDSDCRITGCSGEVCSVTPKVTTCEFDDSFPNVQGLHCGCVKDKCGWQ
ncbi:MAG: hypothetical protein WEA04_01625 [Candidatus Andersenbacteria bacterium]